MSEVRLIDANALKEEIRREVVENRVGVFVAKRILKLIDNAPTVNPYFPFSEEAIYKIMDAEWEHSDNFWITTPSGKKIEFEKKRQSEWIPIKLRPGTDEEYEAFSQYGDCPREDFRVFECPLPDDDQEVLVTTRWGDVCIDIWHRDVDCCYFENNSDDDDVIAWMPLPEKYNSEVNEK